MAEDRLSADRHIGVERPSRGGPCHSEAVDFSIRLGSASGVGAAGGFDESQPDLPPSELYHTAMAVAPVSTNAFTTRSTRGATWGCRRTTPTATATGSPITHAHRLKGNLLLVHGTADDNVHYANTEAVVDELIAANKQFSMFLYPNRTHNISEGRNTTRHLFGLLTRYLQQNLQAGPKDR